MIEVAYLHVPLLSQDLRFRDLRTCQLGQPCYTLELSSQTMAQHCENITVRLLLDVMLKWHCVVRSVHCSCVDTANKISHTHAGSFFLHFHTHPSLCILGT